MDLSCKEDQDQQNETHLSIFSAKQRESVDGKSNDLDGNLVLTDRQRIDGSKRIEYLILFSFLKIH